MIILFLNPITAEAEAHIAVARAETVQELDAFLERERVEPYRDGTWRKIFRKNGPLEWYNPPSGSNLFFEEFCNIGTLGDWLEETRQKWERMLTTVTNVGD